MRSNGAYLLEVVQFEPVTLALARDGSRDSLYVSATSQAAYSESTTSMSTSANTEIACTGNTTEVLSSRTTHVAYSENTAMLSSAVSPLSALELLYAWGDVPGPDLSNPTSSFERRRLAVRGRRVYRNWRTARRAAGCRPPATAAYACHGKQRESAGAITAWSANAPPAPISA